MRFSEILNERLGTLAQLNLGPLAQLLKLDVSISGRSRGRQRPDRITSVANKFVGDNIGSTSEIIDIGAIKNMAAIKKAFKAHTPEQWSAASPKGFVLYLNEKAILFGIVDEDDIRKSVPEIRVAYDFRGTNIEEYLTRFEQEDKEANLGKWRYNPNITPRSSEQDIKRIEYENNERKEILIPVVGKIMSVGELARLINLVTEILKKMGESLTAKIIMSDVTASNKRSSRQTIAYALQKTGDTLKTRLVKYKNTKKPTANSIQEFIHMAMTRQAKVINFNGRPFNTEVSNYENKIEPQSLLKGIPFRISYKSADPNVHGGVGIRFVYDITSGKLVPIEAEYGDTYSERVTVVLDDPLWLKTQVGKIEKPIIIPLLLKYVKVESFSEAKLIIDVLKRLGVDWPELDMIQKSINIEMAKKK